ncbi:MAG: MGMT family protein [Candidatus Brocadiia bacterium]
MLKHCLVKTDFGWCGLTADAGGTIKKIVLPGRNKQSVLKRLGIKTADYADYSGNKLAEELRNYFRGRKVRFKTKPDLSECTRFERKVYRTLQRIPYGRVITYSELARRAGVPGGARAVGNAMARNPLPILIPCHRVVRKNGQIGNFSAIGGAGLKYKLLKLEKAR